VKFTWPAPERNKGPTLDVLSRVLPRQGSVLEIASGTGQHIIHFARHLPALTFLPTDVLDENLASIQAWIAESGLTNVRTPQQLDVTSKNWGVATVSAIFNANMIHIAPWDCAIGLFNGAARTLELGGTLVLYGPFRIGGKHTAESNADFDKDLRRRDTRWGVRDLETVTSLAESVSLRLIERVPMPANNQTLVFVRERS